MRALLLLALLLAATPAARADVCNWISNAPGNWTDGFRWSCGHAPDAADAALIQNGQSVTLNADVSVTSFVLAVGSELTGSGTLTVTGSMSWSSGAMRGSGTTRVAPGATLSLSGDSQRSLTDQRQFVNEGTGTWSGAGMFSNANASEAFINRGTLSVTASRPANQPLFFAGRFVNEPGATLTVAPAGVFMFSSVFDNNGTVEVDAGVLALRGFNGPGGTDSGAYEVAAGATLDFGDIRTVTAAGSVTGDGTLRVTTTVQTVFNGTLDVPTLDMGTGANPTFVLNTDATVETYTLAVGALGGSGTLTVTGAMTWPSGSMGGTGTTLVASGATLALSGESQRALQGQRQLVNEGAATWSGTSAFSNGNQGDAFVNRGTLDLSATRANGGLIFFAGRFVNEAGAVLRKSGATPSQFASLFDNAGTVEIDAGTLSLTGFNGPGGTDTGTYTVCGACTLTLTDLRTLAAGSVIAGTGTVADNDGRPLTNRATVRPGAPSGPTVGTLAWSGPFRPAAEAALDAEIGGMAPGTGHDQLVVAGSAALNGTLRVRLTGGFVPAVGDRFPVVTCTGTCSGQFAGLDLPDGIDGEVQVSAAAAEFVVTEVTLAASAVVVRPTVPLVVPSEGGDARIAFFLTNLTALPLETTTWARLELPGGGVVTIPGDTERLSRPRPLSLAPGAGRRWGLRIALEAAAPEGVYRLTRFVGTQGVDTLAQATVAFTKAGPPASGASAPLAEVVGAEVVGADDPDAEAERIVVAVTPAGAVPTAAVVAAPTATALWAPAPNPAAGRTLLRYGLAEAGAVRLAVYDALGREVALVADGPLAEGVHAASLDVSRLAPGVYAVHLSAGSVRATQRLVVTR